MNDPAGAAPPPIGPYTPVVRAGGWLVVSGQLGMAAGELVGGGTASEVGQALANLRRLLEAEGASLDHVVKTTVFLVDMDDYGAMNQAYQEAFGAHRPARSAVAVAALPRRARVEVEAWAWVGG